MVEGLVYMVVDLPVINFVKLPFRISEIAELTPSSHAGLGDVESVNLGLLLIRAGKRLCKEPTPWLMEGKNAPVTIITLELPWPKFRDPRRLQNT